MKNRLSTQIRHQSLRPINGPHADGGGADPKLLELVRLHLAQIHQCPISAQMHLDELTARGETKKRLAQLETWRTSSLFDETERAALAWSEKITLGLSRPFPPDLIRETRPYFTKGAFVSLTLAIIAVNDWIFAGGQ